MGDQMHLPATSYHHPRSDGKFLANSKILWVAINSLPRHHHSVCSSHVVPPKHYGCLPLPSQLCHSRWAWYICTLCLLGWLMHHCYLNAWWTVTQQRGSSLLVSFLPDHFIAQFWESTKQLWRLCVTGVIQIQTVNKHQEANMHLRKSSQLKSPSESGMANCAIRL